MEIIKLITKVKKDAGALAATKSSGVPFPFRGIDGTMNHLAPHIERAGIVISPRVLNHEIMERVAPDGKRVVKTAKVEMEYTFYAPDGSNIVVSTAGLADDFADRATAQAQSVAFRVALLETFFLPTQSPEPEQTGQAVQDEMEKPASPAQRKIDAARKPAPEVKKPTARDLIRKEFLDTGEVDKDRVNAMVNEEKANADNQAEAMQNVLERLRRGER